VPLFVTVAHLWSVSLFRCSRDQPVVVDASLCSRSAFALMQQQQQQPEEARSYAPLWRLSKQPMFAVEFPGYVQNVDRALCLLGGQKRLTECYLNELENLLELWYRPEDPYSHPILGQIVKTNNLLLRIQRKRRRGDAASPIIHDATMVGIVHRTGRFRGKGKRREF
jgi:hypothetical protein